MNGRLHTVSHRLQNVDPSTLEPPSDVRSIQRKKIICSKVPLSGPPSVQVLSNPVHFAPSQRAALSPSSRQRQSTSLLTSQVKVSSSECATSLSLRSSFGKCPAPPGLSTSPPIPASVSESYRSKLNRSIRIRLLLFTPSLSHCLIA